MKKATGESVQECENEGNDFSFRSHALSEYLQISNGRRMSDPKRMGKKERRRRGQKWSSLPDLPLWYCTGCGE